MTETIALADRVRQLSQRARREPPAPVIIRAPAETPVHQPGSAHRPPEAMLLIVDKMYREQSAANSLSRVAPQHHNPTGEAWLPILHSRQGPWHFTAMFSNSERAHRLGRVRDWVVIHYHVDGQPAGHCTVITQRRGAHTGKRIVRA